ncbi:Wzz/FepE/Etk N-terminal domain-containing protein [Staphylococcus equorum]|uniref:Wzz/FepE/Etk N-terminal domain-containing protein n=1 Tax=Staphylococcus equorum TaxID=246432 RepID=UPI000D1CC384|nr:Wzz/FepE/Etk N-terminal domain-containing protein [Staphylococcus equorum]PTE26811.1 capsule biosynthesis protein CapA [Staphylococcus equorum]
MENSIDLFKILQIIRKNIKLLITLPVICLVFSGIVTFIFLDSKYQASTQVLVNQKENDSQMVAQEVQSNLQLVNTYSEIIKSPRIIDKVSKELKYKYSSSEITNMLTVNNQAESQVLNIDVESKSSNDSEKIANKSAQIFSEEVPDIMNVDNVSILSKADGTGHKISPKISVNLAISFLFGIALAIVIIFTREILDKRIKTEEDIEKVLEIPVLGTIQKFK